MYTSILERCRRDEIVDVDILRKLREEVAFWIGMLMFGECGYLIVQSCRLVDFRMLCQDGYKWTRIVSPLWYSGCGGCAR